MYMGYLIFYKDISADCLHSFMFLFLVKLRAFHNTILQKVKSELNDGEGTDKCGDGEGLPPAEVGLHRPGGEGPRPHCQDCQC
jgi:hypothetical protein